MDPHPSKLYTIHTIPPLRLEEIDDIGNVMWPPAAEAFKEMAEQVRKDTGHELRAGFAYLTPEHARRLVEEKGISALYPDHNFCWGLAFSLLEVGPNHGIICEWLKTYGHTYNFYWATKILNPKVTRFWVWDPWNETAKTIWEREFASGLFEAY